VQASRIHPGIKKMEIVGQWVIVGTAVAVDRVLPLESGADRLEEPIMMDTFTCADLQILLGEREGPCISLYIPTQPGGGAGDQIHWKHVLRDAEKALSERGVSDRDARRLLAPATKKLDQPDFWRDQTGGLAMFLAPEFERSFRLGQSFAKLAGVGDTFHIVPLLPWLAGDGRFFVLAISQNDVRLLGGSRHGVDRLNVPGLPANINEALRTHDPDEPLNLHSHQRVNGWNAVFHGQGVGIDDAKKDIRNYFHRIDKALSPHLGDEKAPMIVATVDYLLPIYREVNSYRHLLESGVIGNPDRLSAADLHRQAWPLVEPIFRTARQSALAQFAQCDGTGLTLREPAAAIGAALEGNIENLFIASGAALWGTVSPLEIHASAQPGDIELINRAAIGAIRHGRPVYVLPAAEMPSGLTVAAILPLPMAKHGKRPGAKVSPA
jgi:hypothetical protein